MLSTHKESVMAYLFKYIMYHITCVVPNSKQSEYVENIRNILKKFEY